MVAQLKSQPPRLTRWPEICSQDWCAVLRAAPIRTTQAKKGEDHLNPEITPIAKQAETVTHTHTQTHTYTQTHTHTHTHTHTLWRQSSATAIVMTQSNSSKKIRIISHPSQSHKDRLYLTSSPPCLSITAITDHSPY